MGRKFKNARVHVYTKMRNYIGPHKSREKYDEKKFKTHFEIVIESVWQV
jgi:hypothetical protein